MLVFPNCKINLGLQVLNKRQDGFHDLETVFYPIPLYDAVEIIQNQHSSSIDFSQTGIKVDVSSSDNLCVKAYHLLKTDFPHLPPVKLHLHKSIPMGAGLGGGSANGAFVLLLLNSKFGLQLSENQLIDYALRLGSDCPFFIRNKPSIATGRGEKMEDIQLDLSPYRIVLVNPKVHINTGWAFKQIALTHKEAALRDVISAPIESWKERLYNDFEIPVFKSFPEVAAIKSTLYDSGALYASMSGSGSTVYGIFPKSAEPDLSFPEHYFVKVL